MAELLLTTNAGLEPIAFAELIERATAAGIAPGCIVRRPSGARGRLLLAADIPQAHLDEIGRGMRTVHHLLRPLSRVDLPAGGELQAIEAAMRAVDLSFLDACQSFRVTTRRHGEHAFTSIDIQRAAGAIVASRTGARVELVHHDVEIRVDVIGCACIIAMQLTRDALSHRHEREWNQRVTLRPNIAYAALRLAGASALTRRVIDPCCGTGTILLEAGAVLPEAELWGSDLAGAAVEGARRNLARAGLAHRSRVACVDAREMSAHYAAGCADLIITNPPFGRRLGTGLHMFAFYALLLREARRVLAPGGRIAVLAHKRDAYLAACRKNGLRPTAVRVVETGGLHTALIVAKEEEAPRPASQPAAPDSVGLSEAPRSGIIPSAGKERSSSR